MNECRHNPNRVRASRTAFTLIELLVVIAMIGILIAMLLPAIQAAREAARRASCVNRLMQLGLALHQYELAHGALPPGSIDAEGPIRSEPEGYHMSWIVQVLPYLDERNTFGSIDFDHGAYAPENAAVRQVGFSQVICPSFSGQDRVYGAAAEKPEEQEAPEPDDLQPADDWTWRFDPWERSRGNVVAVVSTYAGCHHEVESPIDADNHGVLYLNSRVATHAIPDGAAHTFMVGEKRDGVELGWMAGTRDTLRNTGKPLWEVHRSRSGYPTPAEDWRNDGPGAVGDGMWGVAAGPPPLEVGSFGSEHPGVSNFLFADGAVRSVADSIAPDTYRQLGHRSDGKLLRDGPTRPEFE